MAKGFTKVSVVEVPNNSLAALMYYMKERESIRLKKESGKPWPWTGDKILQTYKFTNVKRAHDRTTKAFVKFYTLRWKPRKDGEETLLYNCGIARYFGTEAFQKAVGWQLSHYPMHLSDTAADMFKSGKQVFTGAYMITNAQISGPKEKVVAYFLGGLWKKRQAIVDAIREHRSWKAGYDVMSTLPGFKGSGFMCKEVLQDYLLMTRLPIDDAETWTPMGPGARRGMNRLLGRKKDYKQPEDLFIDEVQQVWSILAPWWKKAYPKAEKLTAHDVQFCLCEFDKYERTRLKQGRPRSLYRGGSNETA